MRVEAVPVRGRNTERGALLIEIMLGLLVLALAAAGSVSSTVSGMSLEKENRETAVAANTLRHLLEELETLPLEELYARFNADPADDPGGAGTALGSSFVLDERRTSQLLGNDPLPYASPPPVEETYEDADYIPMYYPPAEATRLRQPLTVEFSFPLDAYGNLAENVTGGVWGTQGWDLDLDGTVAGGDRSQSYRVLPVHVRVTWEGTRGMQSIETVRVIAPRK